MAKVKENYSKSVENIITSNIPIVHLEETISNIENSISKKKFDTIDYIYVIDDDQKLVGVFSIKELFLNSKDKKAKEIIKTNLVKAYSNSTQEQVAILALKNNLKAIPIVDKDNKLLGIISSDSILEILHLENVEDFLRSVGIYGSVKETLEGTPFFLAKIRTPWLVIGLIGGLFAALVIEFFEKPLKSHFILASFIPLMVYIADAVGAQTQTIFIRNIIFEEKVKIFSYLLKEIKTGLMISLILSSLLFLISVFLFKADFLIGLIAGVSLLLTVIMAMLIGTIIPWLLNKFKKDPAIGSGPFATIIRDILTLIIYFVVISLMFKLF